MLTILIDQTGKSISWTGSFLPAFHLVNGVSSVELDSIKRKETDDRFKRNSSEALVVPLHCGKGEFVLDEQPCQLTTEEQEHDRCLIAFTTALRPLKNAIMIIG